MLNALFFTVSKKQNSTYVPAASAVAYTVQVNINDTSSSLMNPQLRLTIPGNNILTCNYVQIPAFYRYYYIDDWYYNGDGTWTASCSVDVLASWKYDIRNSGGYVNRAYSTANGTEYWDQRLVDDIYPVKDLCIFIEANLMSGTTPTFAYDYGLGSFVIGAVSTPRDQYGDPLTTAAPTVGAITYYVVTPSEMRKLVSSMTAVTSNDWENLGLGGSDFMLNTIKTYINPLQFVVSCKWFPFTVTGVSSSTETIYLGGWNSTAVGKRLLYTWQHIPNSAGPEENYIRIGPILNVNEITQATGYPDTDVDANGKLKIENYPSVAPYASYTLITPFGTFDLDDSIMSEMFKTSQSYRYVAYSVTADLISGKGTLIVEPWHYQNAQGSGTEFFRRDIDVGLDIPIAQISKDNLGYVANGISIGTRILNDIPTGLASGIRSMGTNTQQMGEAVRSLTDDIVQGSKYTPAMQSTSTSAAAFTPRIQDFMVVQKRYRTVDRDARIFGRPVKKPVANLLTFSGYVQMGYTNFSGSCTAAEKSLIIGYLTDGLYIE